MANYNYTTYYKQDKITTIRFKERRPLILLIVCTVYKYSKMAVQHLWIFPFLQNFRG